MIGDVITWLTDGSHWTDTRFDTGILTQLLAHIRFCGIALAIALLIALPLGLFIGHTGRFRWLVAAANAVRALPTVGVLVLLTVIISPHFQGRTDTGFVIPTVIVLVLLAVPPILSNTFAGVENVDPGVRDAASGMGMTGSQVLLRVELPISLPLIFSGVRSAALQLIATATVASYLPLGGLGRFIYDGLAQQDYPQMIGGGVLVAVLALVTDLVLATIQRYVVSRGVTRRFSTKSAAVPDSRLAAVTEAEGARA